jgi:hypothetical protein
MDNVPVVKKGSTSSFEQKVSAAWQPRLSKMSTQDSFINFWHLGTCAKVVDDALVIFKRTYDSFHANACAVYELSSILFGRPGMEILTCLISKRGGTDTDVHCMSKYDSVMV